MMPQAGANALSDSFHKPLVSRVHAALGHDVHRQLLRRASALSIAQRAENDPRDLALVSRMARRERFGLYVRQINVRVEHADRRVQCVYVDQKLARLRLMMLELSRYTKTL